jgi:hypothetical protein
LGERKARREAKRRVTAEDIAAHTKHTARTITAVQLARQVRELDSPIFEGDASLHDVISAAYGRVTEDVALDRVWYTALRKAMFAAIEQLPEQMRVCARAVLDGKSPQDVYTERYGATRNEANRMYARTKRRLAKLLKDFAPEKTRAYRGVKRHSLKWHARIRVNRECKYLGSFRSSREAALAYDRAALKYHGEKAKLNFPELAGSAEVA